MRVCSHVMVNWRMQTFVRFRHSLLLMIGLLLMYPTESLFRDGNVILLNKCNWNTYDQTNIIQETGVKSRIHCAVICFQYGETCLGFEVFKLVSTIGCRLFNAKSRENCASPTTITSSSLYYRRTDIQDTTTQPLPTTTSNPCQNGGTYSGSTCACLFGCSGQYCQTCINECKEATGVSGSGSAWIKPVGFDVPKHVWCQFDYGVTYIQIRKYGNVNFNRSFAEYENGFGDALGDYWLGNKYANTLSHFRAFTSGFTLMNSGGNTMAYFYNFVILDSTAIYAVQYTSASSASYPLDQNEPFQAYDTNSACAVALGSGWWFGSTCVAGSLNGPYPVNFGSFYGATTTKIGIY